ncbi:uncharacterized protein LOC131048077 isoform X2 [Cryptomeria japonica]|uniref:uncharacterized protein LOC131048077 isoform X2 n=1 Tax=Cryptomeria japonica TaxID=3369 RepID=UPI0027D9CFCB|nr:uncharacterized protein LOC131048077 isoform X2 [Cryptomeria japonica]
MSVRMLSCHSLPSYTWNRVAALEKLRPTRQLSTNKRRPFVFAVRGGIDIDRRAFFNQQLCRQLEAEAIEAEAEISCPIHCVREVQSHREFEKVLNDAQEHNKLVVLDFYNTSCGSCKYILPQFIKLCKKGLPGIPKMVEGLIEVSRLTLGIPPTSPMGGMSSTSTRHPGNIPALWGQWEDVSLPSLCPQNIPVSKNLHFHGVRITWN